LPVQLLVQKETQTCELDFVPFAVSDWQYNIRCLGFTAFNLLNYLCRQLPKKIGGKFDTKTVRFSFGICFLTRPANARFNDPILVLAAPFLPKFQVVILVC
jgi:hypothetical protein